MIRHALFATLALAAIGDATAQTHTPHPTGAVIAAALADPGRADQQADDDRRKAAQVLAFSGVKPGDTVVDFLPGAGYWTRIFTGIVGPAGHVYAVWPAGAERFAAKSLPALQARRFANVTAEVQKTALPTAPVPVDLFWTVQNYHDIPRNGAGEPALRAFDAAVFTMLKRGGTYMIIDHADAPGTVMAGAQDKHRIDPAFVKRQVQSVGFRFVGASTVLANPADDHAKSVFDPAIRGHSDQFVYKFRKPQAVTTAGPVRSRARPGRHRGGDPSRPAR